MSILLYRDSRSVSHSYEANVLRGLIKLAKFRFRSESLTDTSYGGKTFEDVPVRACRDYLLAFCRKYSLLLRR
jgi:hypothetical protein